MRRAEDRRAASIMISNSIRWSLAGYEVDWTMNTSSPRTFSWISTKISMSAKRRTMHLASGNSRYRAMSSAKGRLALPAMILIEDFMPAGSTSGVSGRDTS